MGFPVKKLEIGIKQRNFKIPKQEIAIRNIQNKDLFINTIRSKKKYEERQ